MNTELSLFLVRRWLDDPQISSLHSARPETKTAVTITIQREDDSHQFHSVFHIFLSAIPRIEAKICLPHYLKWLSESIHTAGEQKHCQWHFHLLLSLHCHTLCHVLCPNPLFIPLSSLLVSCLPWFVSFPFFLLDSGWYHLLFFILLEEEANKNENRKRASALIPHFLLDSYKYFTLIVHM